MSAYLAGIKSNQHAVGYHSSIVQVGTPSLAGWTFNFIWLQLKKLLVLFFQISLVA